MVDKTAGISMIVPTLDRPDMLNESLCSLKNRTNYESKEVILVDGTNNSKHYARYEQMRLNGLFDRLVPQLHPTRLTDGAYLAGLESSNPDYPYIYFGADDLLYRTGWAGILVEMIESDWAKRNNVTIISGFNTWSSYDDYGKMTTYVKEMYKSEDGKVEGYVCEWGGNLFLRKDYFYKIEGFINNMKVRFVPQQYADSYEAILQYKLLELGHNWGTTRETYVQTMATPGSSTLGNYRLDEKGNPVNSDRYANGVAIGVGWKNI